MGRETRKLSPLISIGPAKLGDFEQLGIPSVAQLTQGRYWSRKRKAADASR